MSSKNRIPLVILFCIAFVITGLIFSVLVTRTHYLHVSGGQSTGCSISSYVDCDKVSASNYSTFLGVPNSVFSFAFFVLFFLAFICTLFFKKSEIVDAYIGIVLILAFISVLISVFLVVISLTVIRALCIYCTVIQIMNLAIFFSLLIHRRGKLKKTVGAFFSTSFFVSRYFILFIGILVIAGLGGFLFASQMKRALSTENSVEVSGKSRQAILKPEEFGFSSLFKTVFSPEVFQIETEGSPKLGTNSLGIQIIVFSDFNCGYCKEFHKKIDPLVEEFNFQIEVVYKFFPLDWPCNPVITRDVYPSSCEAAAAAYLAHEDDKFWQYSDILYDNAHHFADKQLVKYARDARISDTKSFEKRLDDPSVQRKIFEDAEDGVKAGIDETPTIFLNGQKLLSQKIMPGHTRYSILRNVINDWLKLE